MLSHSLSTHQNLFSGKLAENSGPLIVQQKAPLFVLDRNLSTSRLSAHWAGANKMECDEFVKLVRDTSFQVTPDRSGAIKRLLIGPHTFARQWSILGQAPLGTGCCWVSCGLLARREIEDKLFANWLAIDSFDLDPNQIFSSSIAVLPSSEFCILDRAKLLGHSSSDDIRKLTRSMLNKLKSFFVAAILEIW